MNPFNLPKFKCAKNEHWPGVEPEDDSKPCDPSAPGIAYHHGTEIW